MCVCGCGCGYVRVVVAVCVWLCVPVAVCACCCVCVLLCVCCTNTLPPQHAQRLNSIMASLRLLTGPATVRPTDITIAGGAC